MNYPRKTKAQRRRETAQMVKCLCGCVAKFGDRYCGRCRDAIARERAKDEAAIQQVLRNSFIDEMMRKEGVL